MAAPSVSISDLTFTRLGTQQPPARLRGWAFLLCFKLAPPALGSILAGPLWLTERALQIGLWAQHVHLCVFLCHVKVGPRPKPQHLALSAGTNSVADAWYAAMAILIVALTARKGRVIVYD